MARPARAGTAALARPAAAMPRVLQAVRSLQPAEETVLGMTDDRLLGFGKYPPFVQSVAQVLPGMDVFNRAVPKGDVGDRVGDDANPMVGGCLHVLSSRSAGQPRRTWAASSGTVEASRISPPGNALTALGPVGRYATARSTRCPVAAVVGTGQGKPPCQGRRNLDVHTGHFLVVDLADLLVVDVGRVGP